MADTRSKNSKRNLIWAMINKIVQLGLSFICQTVFIYTFGVLYLGLNSLFASTLDFLVLAELGVGAAMVFSMYKPIAENDVVTMCALLNLYRKVYRFIGTVILLGGTIMMFFLPYLIKGEMPTDINIYVIYILTLSKTVMSYFLYAYKGSVLIAVQRSDITSTVGLVLNIVMSACQIIILLVWKNYYLYCGIAVVSVVVSNLIINHIVNKRYPQYKCYGKISKELLTDIKKRVTGLFIYRICFVFRDSLDGVFISAFIGLAVLGKYNNYMFIVNTLTGFLLLARSSITASIGNSIITETEEKNYGDFNKCQLIYMWISIWCTVCMFCMYQPFIKVWLGPDYLLGELEMGMFCLFFICRKLGDICSTYRQAIGLWWQDRYRPITEAIVKTVLNLLVIRLFGVVGALGASVFCLIFINSIWASWVLYRYYFENQRQWDYIKRNIYYLVNTVVLCSVTSYICDFLPGDGFLNLALRAIVCIIVPNLLLWVIYYRTRLYKDSVEMVRGFIKA